MGMGACFAGGYHIGHRSAMSTTGVQEKWSLDAEPIVKALLEKFDKNGNGEFNGDEVKQMCDYLSVSEYFCSQSTVTATVLKANADGYNVKMAMAHHWKNGQLTG